MELLMIRHPPVQGAVGRCYGQLDLPLAEGWQGPLAVLRQRWQQEGQTVWSSPLRRCRDVAGAWGGGVRCDARLMEIHFGTWEGQRWSEIPAEALNAWMADYTREAPPGGETMTQLQIRVRAWLEELRRENRSAVVFTHAGVIRCVLATLLDLPLSRWFQFHIPFLSPIPLQLGEQPEQDLIGWPEGDGVMG